MDRSSALAALGAPVAPPSLLRHLWSTPDALALALLLGLSLPAVAFILWRGHLRDRRGAAGDPRELQPVTVWPDLLRPELTSALLALIVLCTWALCRPLGVAEAADAAFTPSNAKAPWFVIGVQELLQHFDPWLGGIVLPLTLLAFLLLLPYLDAAPRLAGRQTLRGRLGAVLVTVLLLVLWLAPTVVGEFFRGAHFVLQPSWWPDTGHLPAPPAATTLGERLGLGAVGARVIGALVVLGPYLGWALAWPRVRRRARGLGQGGAWRYAISGAFAMTLALVLIKLACIAFFDIRYLWVVTAELRI